MMALLQDKEKMHDNVCIHMHILMSIAMLLSIAIYSYAMLANYISMYDNSKGKNLQYVTQ